jgi:protein-disulfide isomerase
MKNSQNTNQGVKQDLMQQIESDHCAGAPDARLILLQYGDYECPACAYAAPLTKHLTESYGAQVKFIYRHYPLTDIHPLAEQAAEAAEAAGAQGRFWEMHELLYSHSPHLKLAALWGFAERLELDMARFKAEMLDRIYLQRVQEHRQSGEILELRGTPTFFLSGKMIDVSFGLENLAKAVYAAVEVSGG